MLKDCNQDKEMNTNIIQAPRFIRDTLQPSTVQISPLPFASFFMESLTKIRQDKTAADLKDDFLRLYKQKTLSDFELRSGDVSFPVHKAVLSARSPGFHAMFCSGKDADCSFKDVSDIDPTTLDRLLTFIYTSTIESSLLWEDAFKLYSAADKYKMSNLKFECCFILESGLKVSNLCDVLELADRCNDPSLEDKVHEFLLKHLDEVVVSDNWKKFLEKNSYLAGRAITEAFEKKDNLKNPKKTKIDPET